MHDTKVSDPFRHRPSSPPPLNLSPSQPPTANRQRDNNLHSLLHSPMKAIGYALAAIGTILPVHWCLIGKEGNSLLAVSYVWLPCKGQPTDRETFYPPNQT